MAKLPELVLGAANSLNNEMWWVS